MPRAARRHPQAERRISHLGPEEGQHRQIGQARWKQKARARRRGLHGRCGRPVSAPPVAIDTQRATKLEPDQELEMRSSSPVDVSAAQSQQMARYPARDQQSVPSSCASFVHPSFHPLGLMVVHTTRSFPHFLELCCCATFVVLRCYPAAGHQDMVSGWGFATSA